MLYLIGGSPCSGKSTISSFLARQYDLVHIKIDDLTDQLTEQAILDRAPISFLRRDRSPDQIWLRRPEAMADEEWYFYEEIFPYLKSYLIKNQEQSLLVEGAGLLPHLVNSLTLPNAYLCLTPTADFQLTHYAKREWVPYILKGCSNPEEAFKNWMQRDILFAQRVREEAAKLGYPSLVTDGSQTEVQLAEEIARLLKLTKIDIKKGENHD
ncbi:AAA family ATPase [Streptococcus panodentis]|uniref:AAA family ATPase n=1 Tax=Streptococcus panodentis TaxID=1581472 RepID=A0ABS5AYL8_9STRE|nr:MULTISPECIES: AAA family ATPase [Streptococcus]KXT82375.1 hypothetical protein STRDD11_01876 [Streptococcus sp. DD11]MBP2621682.1 AAA family ATPase [Streptococcus panodentis]